MTKVYFLTPQVKRQFLIMAAIAFATLVFFPIGLLMLYFRQFAKVVISDEAFEVRWLGTRRTLWSDLVAIERDHGRWDRVVTKRMTFPACLWRFERELEIRALIVQKMHSVQMHNVKL